VVRARPGANRPPDRWRAVVELMWSAAGNARGDARSASAGGQAGL